MSDVLRTQLLALRASAEAAIATIDAALGTLDASQPPAALGRCPHDGTERVTRIATMGSALPVDFCLDCNREIGIAKESAG